MRPHPNSNKPPISPANNRLRDVSPPPTAIDMDDAADWGDTIGIGHFVHGQRLAITTAIRAGRPRTKRMTASRR
jgi:hypothetical protein